LRDDFIFEIVKAHDNAYEDREIVEIVYNFTTKVVKHFENLVNENEQ